MFHIYQQKHLILTFFVPIYNVFTIFFVNVEKIDKDIKIEIMNPLKLKA